MTKTQRRTVDPRTALLDGLPVNERRLRLNGVSTSVLEGGDGPPVVLLHGPGEHAAQWRRVIPSLVKTNRVIAADLPGRGESEMFDGRPDDDRLLGWLDDLIECTCPTPPALVGLMLGGAIAARFASDRSERLSRLVLVDAVGLAAFQPADLERISVPTTLIWGRHDLATPLPIAQAASKRYGWPLHVIENAGDDPPTEQPEAFLEALRGPGAMWDKIAPGYDRTNTPTQMWIASEGLHRAGLRPGMRFLDVAAGSGALSIPAARLGAQVVATDQSPVMLELLDARAREEGLNVTTKVMDGHALALDDNSFDIAGSQFGVMLFPDMPRAIREMVRVVRPGGRVLLHAYGDPHKIEFIGFLITAVQSVRPTFDGPPMDPPPLEFQLSDPDRLRNELAAAGLHDVKVETITETTEHRSGKDLWEWLVWSNPIVEMLLSGMLNLTAAERVVVEQTLEKMVRDRAGSHGAARLTNPVNVGTGTK